MASNEVKFKLSVDGANAVLSSFDQVRSALSGVTGAATTMETALKALTGGLTVGAMVAWTKATIDAADAMNDMSQRVGIAVRDLAKYELATKQSGTTMESLAKGIKGLAGNLVEHGAALKKAGIDTSNADKAMQDLADVFASMPDGVEKTNLAVKLFGKSGMDMIPMLNLGSAGLQTAAEKSAAYALQMATMAPLADAFNDNMADIALSSKVMGMSLLNDALPGLVNISKAMADASLKGGTLAGIMAGIGAGFENYKTNVRNFWGAQQPATGGASGSWGDAAPKATAADDWMAKYKAMMAAIGGDSNAAKALAAANKELEAQAKLLAELSGLSGSFAQDWDRLSAMFAKGTLNLEDLTAAQAALLAKQPIIKAGIDDEKKARDELLKTRDAELKAHATELTSLGDKAQKLEDEVAMYGMSKDAIEALTTARMQDRIEVLRGFDNSAEEIARIEQVIVARKRLATAGTALDAKDASKKAADQMADDQKKAAEESGKYWEDALMRAFESGKGFFQSLWDTIKNTLKTQVLRVLVSATGLTGTSAAGATDMAGSGSNLLGTASSLSNLYGMVSGGLNAGLQGGLQVAKLVGEGALFAGNATVAGFAGGMMSTSSMAAATAAAQAGGAQAAGLIAGSFGNAMTGYAISKAISGGYQVNSSINKIGAIASMIPGVGPIAGVISGLVNRAFGRKATELLASGTRGTFAGDSFDGSNYASYQKKGGWFRSDKNWTDVTAMAAETRDAWSTAFAGVKGSVTGMAAAVGLATDKITSYSKYVDIAAGTTQEQLTAIFTGMADDMATAAAPGIAAFAKTGETASATLTRMGSSITTANAWLSMLRNRLFDVSLSGADAASSLADAFGSLDNLSASSKAYYDLFYSEAERTARSTEDLAKAMALVNIALPTTNAAFRAVVTGLDLNTEAGRNAYAVMLALAPEFAATAAAADQMAVDVAAALIKTFTGNDRLIPALDAAALGMGNVAGGAGSMSLALTYINAIMGNASSGVITLGGNITTLGTGLTASQVSANLLTDQIQALSDSADSACIDFVGLQAALASVNTETFVATLALVFENLADRIGGVINSITTERIAVREAALQIINPTAMGKDAIARGIAGISTGLPSNAGVISANAALAGLDGNVSAAQSMLDGAKAANAASVATAESAAKNFSDLTTYYKSQSTGFKSLMDAYGVWAYGSDGQQAYGYNAATNRVNDFANWSGGNQIGAKSNAAYFPYLDTLGAANTKLAASEAALAAARNAAVVDLTPYSTALAAAQLVQTTAAAAAKKAALDYATALQTFAIDAGKSVTKLTRLREETVKYYESQKALAELMGTSAAGLRKTVGDYRYGQLDPDAQLAQLQGQFSSAYSLALAAQGDGATLAGYGDKLNGLLGPLIDKLGETNKTNLIANYLAQAESVAALIEQTTPVNYQLDSLALLGSIDATLAALDASSQSAEAIIADAVRAGSDRTAAGLSAVIAALTGQAIPAFAAGGYHTGGVRLVGENGPELEVTGPSRIYNASQTRGMLGGGNTARLEALVERQSRQLEAMSFELRAIATSSNKTAKTLERVTPDGTSLQTSVAT